MKKLRLDQLVFEKGLTESRERVRAAFAAQHVRAQTGFAVD